MKTTSNVLEKKLPAAKIKNKCLKVIQLIDYMCCKNFLNFTSFNFLFQETEKSLKFKSIAMSNNAIMEIVERNKENIDVSTKNQNTEVRVIFSYILVK